MAKKKKRLTNAKRVIMLEKKAAYKRGYDKGHADGVADGNATSLREHFFSLC